MQVAVLGAGVIGMTTAYYLNQAGYTVTIYERGTETANGASYANGGQLSYSYTDALAKPSLIFDLPKLALGFNPAVRILGGKDAALLPWGMRVLRECTPSNALANTQAASAITAQSKMLLDQLQQHLNLPFLLNPTGKLILYSSHKEFNTARYSAEIKQRSGVDIEALEFAQACLIEPALNHFATNYVGATYAKDDWAADCQQFCVQLENWLEQNSSTKFRYNESINRLVTSNGKLIKLTTNNDEYPVDLAVVCAGAWSRELLQDLPIDVPIYPVRGYSLTLPKTVQSPKVSITDSKRRVVFSPLGERLRIAGFADFNGFDQSRDHKRISQLTQISQKIAPQAAKYHSNSKQAWGGYRPMTPTGLPMVGATAISGLYMNTGHGMLGWTMACATAHQVAQTIQSEASSYPGRN